MPVSLFARKNPCLCTKLTSPKIGWMWVSWWCFVPLFVFSLSWENFLANYYSRFKKNTAVPCHCSTQKSTEQYIPYNWEHLLSFEMSRIQGMAKFSVCLVFSHWWHLNWFLNMWRGKKIGQGNTGWTDLYAPQVLLSLLLSFTHIYFYTVFIMILWMELASC